MDLTPNEDQVALRETAMRWLGENLPLSEARKRNPAQLREMTAMGWIGMTSPDVGFDHASEALVFAEMGRHLAPLAALSTAVAARWLGTEGKVALAIGEGAATALGLWDGVAGSIALPESLENGAGLDLSTTLTVLDKAPAPTPINDPRAARHLALLAAAYALGCAEGARDMAADYALIREQFERQIGAFQAIKHMCADMAVRSAVARSQLYYAACALDEDSADSAYHVAAAKRLADRAALENTRTNIQVHGGIGMTDEANPHLLLKRAHLLAFVAPVATEELLSPLA